MADVFISYASEDRERAHAIADVLEGRGWTVWWDRQILPGETFESVIERELANADCVLVLWSQYSVQSHWAKAEAEEAMNRGVLVPALIDDVRIPIAFRHVQAASLIDWTPAAVAHPGFQMLEQSIRNLDRPDAPAAAPAAASPQVQPRARAADGVPRARSVEDRLAAPAGVPSNGRSAAAAKPRTGRRVAVMGAGLLAVVVIGSALMSGDDPVTDADAETAVDAAAVAAAEAPAFREQEALDAGYETNFGWDTDNVEVAGSLTYTVDAQPGLEYLVLASTTADCTVTVTSADLVGPDHEDPASLLFVVDEPQTITVHVNAQSASAEACSVGSGVYLRKAAAAAS